MLLRGKGFWKFNMSSLTSNVEYVEKNEEWNFQNSAYAWPRSKTDKHFRWEYLKYEIQKFPMQFSKKFDKEEKLFTKEQQKFETNLTNFQTNQHYLKR